MKKSIFQFLLFVIPICGFSQTIVPAGFVSGPWTLAGSPYIVQGAITCGNLTIQAGVDVRFQGWGMTVYGCIKAVGTALQPITFEADDTTGWTDLSTGVGGWAGIYLPGNATDTTIMDHCIIKDCKCPATSNYSVCLLVYTTHFILSNSEVYHNCILGSTSTLRFSQNSPTIINNTIHDNYGALTGGVDIESSHGLVSGNEFYHNTGSQGAAIYCNSGTDPVGPTIINNNIHNNRSNYNGGGMMIQSGRATVFGNNISYNHAAEAGSGMYVADSHVIIISNWICNNTDSIYPACGINDGGGGININNNANDTAEVYNNIIANNTTWYSGGGIRLSGGGAGGTVFIENNHIVNNTAHLHFFTGGIELADNIHAHIRNNIIWGNRGYTSLGQVDTMQVLGGASDTIVFEYNCGESSYYGGVFVNVNTQVTGNAASNISVYGVNPGFVAPSTGVGNLFDATLADWHLTSSSVCINMGTINLLEATPQTFDIYTDPRIIGNTIDIGAVEYQVVEGMMEHSVASINIFPNPVSDILYLKNETPFTEIHITDAIGHEILNQNYGQGIDVSQLASGIYFISFQDEDGNLLTQRFVKQ